VTLSSLPGFNAEFLASLDAFPHGHDHGGGGGDEVVDARAMWFAAGAIGVKEWLYRASKIPTLLLHLSYGSEQ
jgi:hypothetical protein